MTVLSDAYYGQATDRALHIVRGQLSGPCSCQELAYSNNAMAENRAVLALHTVPDADNIHRALFAADQNTVARSVDSSWSVGSIAVGHSVDFDHLLSYRYFVRAMNFASVDSPGHFAVDRPSVVLADATN